MPVNIEICQCRHLSSVRPWFWRFWMKNSKCINFDEISYLTQVEGGEFNSNNSFLWFSMSVKFDTCGQNLTNLTIDTCDPFFHSFGPKMANLPILMKFCILHKLSTMNSIVTIVLWDSWRLPILTIVSIGTCYLLGHGFRPKMANASVLIKFCTLHKTRVVNSMVSILRDASGCCRKIKLRIQKQIFCQKYYCYKIMAYFRKVVLLMQIMSTQLLVDSFNHQWTRPWTHC